MAKVEVVVQDVPEQAEEREEQVLQETAHRFFLASIGAMALAQDMLSTWVTRLIERGEAAEQEGRRMMRSRMEKRKHQVRKLAQKQEKVAADADAELRAEVENLLDRMNVPTKSDIDALGAQVAELTKKVDGLKKA
jgi:poly(hydroxyalkanoate) granule-associated protein